MKRSSRQCLKNRLKLKRKEADSVKKTKETSLGGDNEGPN